MPPFSGKKKKVQLKEKRQRKRAAAAQQDEEDRLEDTLREALVNAGELVTIEALEAKKRAYYASLGTDEPHGREDCRRARRSDAQADRKSRGPNTANAPHSGEAADAANTGSSRSSSATDEEYTFDPHRRGLRSAFLRESRAELEERRRMTYLPLTDRELMDLTVGVPFGRWLRMPRRGAPRMAAAGAQSGVDRPCSGAADSNGSGSSKSLPTQPIVSDDGVGSSLHFPIAVETPTRGWAPAAARGASASASPPLDALRGLCVCGDVVMPLGASPQSAVQTERLVEVAVPTSPPVSAQDAERSDDERSSNSRTSSGGNAAGGSAEAAEMVAGEEGGAVGCLLARRRAIEAIEEARFKIYLRTVEKYPFATSAVDAATPAQRVASELCQLTPSSCERNLDVWRQLWRAEELSDVCVVVVDARFPAVHIHTGLLSYITQQKRKPCVLVMNKVDLVPKTVLECWLRFLPLFLASLGFLVLPAEEAACYMDNWRAEAKEARDEDEDEAKSGHQRRSAPIVLHTFTANPTSEEGFGGEPSAGTLFRRGTTGNTRQHAKLYEQLRRGTVKAAGGSSSSSDGSEDGHGESIDNYARTTNFKGMENAVKQMQVDRREHKELKVVSAMISELLAVCRLLGPEAKRASAAAAAADGSDNDAASAGVEDGSRVQTRPASTPVVAPPCRAPKHKKHKKRDAYGSRPHTSRRRLGASDGHGTSDDDVDGDVGGNRDEVLDSREDDNAAYLHVALLGFPNVGKSSLLNCVRGTKVVSVSSTPGHTKHLQTIPIPSERVTLVDCPGLVAPFYGVPQPLEAVLGTRQVAQTRDPQSGVAYLASHLPLEKVYGLRRSDDADPAEAWSTFELCEAYARKRGYTVKHGKGAPDVHRAATAILQEAYQGKLALYLAPPELNYLQSRQFLEVVRPNLLLPVFLPSPIR